MIACAEELWSRFVPGYLRALGATVVIVAAYGSLKDLLDAVYQFPGGVLTSRFGYRRSLIAFNALAIAGYGAFAGARSWIVLLLALPFVVAWQSFSLPATFSLIGDEVRKGRRSTAFAYQSIVRRVPIVVAPIVGGTIITRFGTVSGTRLAILCGIVLAAAALALQARIDGSPAAPEAPPVLRALLREASSLRGALRSLLVCDIFVRFGQGIGEIFVVLYAIDVVRVSPAMFGWLTALAMVTSLAVYIPVSRIADRYGRESWVLLTYVFFAAFPFLVALGRNLWMLIPAFLAMGLREIGEPPRKAMIVDLAREGRCSIDVGTYYLFRGLAVFPASLIGGAMWKLAPSATFLAAAGVASIGAGIFLITIVRTKPLG